MPSLHDILSDRTRTLLVLRPWAIDAGMPNARNATRARVIAFLVEHPEAVPQEIRDLEGHGPDRRTPLAKRLGNLNRRVSPPPSLATIRTALAPSFDRLEELVTGIGLRVARLETTNNGPAATATPATGEPSSSTLPSSTSTSPDSFAAARAFAIGIHASALESLLSGKLDVRDFWKLDPTRTDEAMTDEGTEAESAARSALGFKDSVAALQRSKAKYPDFASIARSWIPFCQISDILTPGSARFLLGHLQELARLDVAYPSDFVALLEYHLKFARTHILANTIATSPHVWMQTDTSALERHFHPFRGKKRAGPSNASSAQSSSNALPAWDPKSTGSAQSTQACNRWNAKLPCPGDKCRYRHMCSDCSLIGQGAGHPGCRARRLRHAALSRCISTYNIASPLFPGRLLTTTPSPLFPGRSALLFLIAEVAPRSAALRSTAPSALFLLGRAVRLPPARPNTTPAPGFSPAGASPAQLGGSLQSAVSDWALALADYPDRSFVDLLLSVINNGATLGTVGTVPRIRVEPYTSSPAQRDFLVAETARRLAAGEISVVDDSSLIAVTSLAAVPKERTKFRAIHDLRPVNDFVPKPFGTFTYTYLSEFFSKLRTMPRGCSLWKTDLSNAFRHIRLSPEARLLAGFVINGVTYTDRCLPFGSRIAPFTFNLLAEAFHWVLEKYGVPYVRHYLDDFFGVATSPAEALNAMNTVFLAASSLGISINPSKSEGPVTTMVILGIEIDTVRMEARVDSRRRDSLVDDINGFLRRSPPTGSRLELQQLAGLLNFVCQVIPLGHVFLRRLWDAISERPSGPLRRRLSPSLVRDLKWWLALLRDWNGILLLDPPPRPTVLVWTDASGTLGAGGHLGPAGSSVDAFRYSFAKRHRGKDIQFKELHAALHAATTWSSSWGGCHVIFHIDNQAICSGLTSGSIRNESAQSLLRSFWLLAAVGGWTFTTTWISSSSNGLADAISRLAPRWSAGSLLPATPGHPRPPLSDPLSRVPSSFRLTVPDLSDSAAYFLYVGIATSTRSGYASSVRSFDAFCARTGVSALSTPVASPASVALCNWAADLAASGTCRPGSVRHHLAGLRSYHTDIGADDTAFDSPQLARVLRGIRRHFGDKERRERLPVTLPVLVRVLNALNSVQLNAADRRALSAAFALAYVGGMRSGEITFDAGAFDPRVDISRSDFTDYGSYATVRLPASKTDPFRKGVDIIVPSAPPGAPVDPLRLLREHVALLPATQIPLFSRIDASAISRGRNTTSAFPRSWFVDKLRLAISHAGLNASSYAGHSFRRGLATWAKISARLSDDDIKLLGRWSSSAVKLYQDTPIASVAALARSTLIASSEQLAASAIPAPSNVWWNDDD